MPKDLSKVLIVGHGTQIGASVAKVLADKGIHIELIPADNAIQIAGESYVEREPVNVRIPGGIASSMLLLASMMGGISNRPERQRPVVDLIEEFKLIQDKKSNLSRSDREWVVAHFTKSIKLFKMPKEYKTA